LRASAFLFLLAVSFQGEAQDRLIPGPGSTLTENKCRLCHELQHIRRAPLSRGEWEDNVRNMRERGTPLTDAEAAVIVDYLATYYNREKPAPAAGPDTLAAASADPLQKSLNDNGCLACHALKQRVVGPSFSEVATKYSGDAGAPARLAAKIRQGGQGVWGQVPMPPNPGLPDAELQAIVGWILRQQ
jgi:sulfite dehydrogenase